MFKNLLRSAIAFFLLSFLACTPPAEEKKIEMKFSGAPGEIKLITLDPGHFHAALVQKFPYGQVDTTVHIYAPAGPDLDGHLARINSYNERKDNPTQWNSVIYKGTDFLDKMLAEKRGNVVVISGNNAHKTHYIQSCIEAGLHVLADKPMAIKPKDFDSLEVIFNKAAEKGVLVYDIMTERYEITTILQKELSGIPELFGTLEKGTAENPAITKESIHHFFKYVSGQPLIRPAWFFDVEQQGEGIVDVSTHLVDLVFWECFPERIIKYDDLRILHARRSSTDLTPAQFGLVTGLPSYPDFLTKDITADSLLKVFSNGEIIFEVNGIVAKVSVIWNYQAPEGAADTHYSIMRGTKANLVIKQGAEQGYKPVLYIEPSNGAVSVDENVVKQAMSSLEGKYPGVVYEAAGKSWKVVVPEKYNIGHEAHFGQVAERYMQYLVDGKLPDWEVPNMLAKYFVTTKAYQMSH